MLFFPQLQGLIPPKWRENMGADLYQQYMKLRLKMLKGQVLRTKGERSIEYVKIEQGKSQRLIFLPGFADCKENFFDAAHFLMSDFDMLIPDLPGFGRSFRRHELDYTVQNYGLWLEEFIEQSAWEDFHLVGNSLGGAIAIDLALKMPHKIKSLTLIDTAGVPLADYSSVYHEFVQGRNVFQVQTRAQFKYFLNRVFHRPPLIPPLMREHLFQELARNSRWHRKVLADLLEGLLDFEDPRVDQVAYNKRLHQIKLPTLIVWGDEDTFFPPETGHFIQQQIPHAKLYILADIGHGPQIEAPLKFARIFKKFCRRLPEQVAKNSA